jgi:RNA polymerase sigma-70 factor, ECF subfamily
VVACSSGYEIARLPVLEHARINPLQAALACGSDAGLLTATLENMGFLRNPSPFDSNRDNLEVLRSICAKIPWLLGHLLVNTIALESDLHEEERNKILVAQILRGEHRLFHDLVHPYERGLFLAANAVLRNEANAEDAVQEAILKAFLNLQQLECPKKFKSWLFRIVINEARLKIRNSRGSLFEPLEEDPWERPQFVLQKFAAWHDNPLQMMERAEIRGAVNKALQSLRAIYREIFILRDVQEFTVSECAEALGITAETVKVRLHRARLMLREKLASKFKLSWH